MCLKRRNYTRPLECVFEVSKNKGDESDESSKYHVLPPNDSVEILQCFRFLISSSISKDDSEK